MALFSPNAVPMGTLLLVAVAVLLFVSVGTVPDNDENELISSSPNGMPKMKENSGSQFGALFTNQIPIRSPTETLGTFLWVL